MVEFTHAIIILFSHRYVYVVQVVISSIRKNLKFIILSNHHSFVELLTIGSKKLHAFDLRIGKM